MKKLILEFHRNYPNYEFELNEDNIQIELDETGNRESVKFSGIDSMLPIKFNLSKLRFVEEIVFFACDIDELPNDLFQHQERLNTLRIVGCGVFQMQNGIFSKISSTIKNIIINQLPLLCLPSCLADIVQNLEFLSIDTEDMTRISEEYSFLTSQTIPYIEIYYSSPNTEELRIVRIEKTKKEIHLFTPCE